MPLWCDLFAVSVLGNVFYWHFLPVLEAGEVREGKILQKRR